MNFDVEKELDLDSKKLLIKNAIDGSTHCARIILEWAIQSLKDNQPLHPLLAKYLSECLKETLDDKTSNQVFNLSESASRPSMAWRDLPVAIDYFQYRANGEKAEVARLLTADVWGLTPSTVKRICREYHQRAEKEVTGLENIKETHPKEYKSFLEGRQSINVAIREDIAEEALRKKES